MLITSCQKEEPSKSVFHQTMEELDIDVSLLTPKEVADIKYALQQDQDEVRNEINRELRQYGVDPDEFWGNPVDIVSINERMNNARANDQLSLKKATPVQCNNAYTSYVRVLASPTASLSGIDLVYLRALNFEISGNYYFATKAGYISEGLSSTNAQSITGINFSSSIIFTTSDYNILLDAIVGNCP